VIYRSMLRGINVGGNKRIKMETLRQSFEALGFQQVKTFTPSGNVVFTTAAISPQKLSKQIEIKLLADFGFPVAVVSRTADELRKTIDENPFLKERGVDPEKLHVLFLSNPVSGSSLKKLTELTVSPDRFQGSDTKIYLHLPNRVAKSKLMKTPLDRILSAVTTTRNWKTVHSLHQMCQECG
jgi:uncharacterized protein (DUF1697 family)